MSDWISVEDRLPSAEELEEVLALYKKDAIGDYLLPVTVSNIAYFLKNIQDFSHWAKVPEYKHLV